MNNFNLGSGLRRNDDILFLIATQPLAGDVKKLKSGRQQPLLLSRGREKLLAKIGGTLVISNGSTDFREGTSTNARKSE